MIDHSPKRTRARSGLRHLARRATLPLAFGILLLVAPGCATKGYVRQHVAASEAATNAHLATLDHDVAENRTLAGEAMEKATLAEKLAAGAIDYTVVSTYDMRFAFDDFRLDGEAQSVLDDLATALAGRPRGIIELRGFADATGPDRYNYRLGRERAESVERYLVSRHGIAPARVALVSFGEDEPVAGNDTQDGRAQNRRVTARLLEVVPRPGDTPVAYAP